MNNHKQIGLAAFSLMILNISVLSAPQKPKPPPLSSIDRRLRASAAQTQYLLFYGDGELWNKCTQENVPIGQGIKVNDKKLITSLLNIFRCTDDKWQWKPTAGGYIHVDFIPTKSDKTSVLGDKIHYERRGTDAEDVESMADGLEVSLQPGSGPNFEAFVSKLAKRAHSHDPQVFLVDLNAS